MRVCVCHIECVCKHWTARDERITQIFGEINYAKYKNVGARARQLHAAATNHPILIQSFILCRSASHSILLFIVESTQNKHCNEQWRNDSWLIGNYAFYLFRSRLSPPYRTVCIETLMLFISLLVSQICIYCTLFVLFCNTYTRSLSHPVSLCVFLYLRLFCYTLIGFNPLPCVCVPVHMVAKRVFPTHFRLRSASPSLLISSLSLSLVPSCFYCVCMYFHAISDALYLFRQQWTMFARCNHSSHLKSSFVTSKAHTKAGYCYDGCDIVLWQAKAWQYSHARTSQHSAA